MPGIAIDDATDQGGATTSSLSWSHTVTGRKPVLTVGATSVDTVAGHRDVTGITYAGIDLDKIGEDTNGNRTADLWYLLNPPTGSNTVVVTYADVVNRAHAGAISLTGVLGLDASNSANGTSSTATVDVTTIKDNTWLIDVMATLNAATPTAGGGQTSRWFRNSSDLKSRGSTEGPATPAGAVTMSWGLGSSQPWMIVAASFAPATGGGMMRAFYEDRYEKIRGILQPKQGVYLPDGSFRPVPI